MTEYGRGQAPEPWHPNDPLYGDQGWTGQHQVPSQYPQEQQPQQYEQYEQYPHQQQYVQQQHPQQQYPQGQQYQQHPQDQQYYGGQQAYDTQAGHVHAADPYGGGVDPYAAQQPVGYPGGAPDLYSTADAYPPPQPPGRRTPIPDPATEWQQDDQDGPDAADAEDEGRTAEDGGGGAEDDGRDGPHDGGRRSGRGKAGKGKKPKKRRNGVACLFVALVLVGGVGGVGYYGYSFLQDKFGEPADFTGEGTDPVDVEIKAGSSLGAMGRALKEAGVVASVDAFTEAAGAHPKGTAIQPGVYPLRKGMSAAAAVELMTDPSKLNVVTVTEGMRNAAVYAAVDKKLKLKPGTTLEVSKRELKNLGLPAWANNNPKIMDPLEGFLYPARYDLTKDMKPEALLKEMVARAKQKYEELGIEGKAKDLGLESPLQVVTVASMVNAEGMNHDDFRKMAEVVYNRLKPDNVVTNHKIEFDSTINYAKGTSNIHVSRKEAKEFNHPYNTYFNDGLTPGPIGNPGDEALNATLDPDEGGWMFFVSVDGKKTSFTKTYDEHLKLVDEFNARQKNGG
ncbi:endolytic transglycosylase MltG [Streptomyces venezuelae]|uniref:Endolytic murein transglycosylase n=1 Tax=Streptomyces venezuelae TaxID=54571 RepID=A0A5P2DCR8_STRVZ|nr:endolytic transglycosylase MltG [Streptomyces venezuelae]QES51051.1 endolytic transglycosylase MltG [Streptomyces venezuelae]